MTSYPIPGVYGMKPETYYSDPMPTPSLTSTIARVLINRTPLHAWTASPQLNPDWQPTERKVYDLGRAAHRKALGAGDPFTAIPSGLLAKNGSTNTNAANAFIAVTRANGIVPLKEEEVAQIDAMTARLHAVLPEYLVEGADGKWEPLALNPAGSEMAALAEIDGCPVRALFDNLPPGKPYFIDFKTCEDSSLESITKSIARYSYDVQMQWYREVLHAATGEARRPILIFQEKAPPYEVAVVELYESDGEIGFPVEQTPDWFQTAKDKCRYARALWRHCLEVDYWPGNPREVAVIGAPAWRDAAWSNRPRSSFEVRARAAEWQAPS